MSYGKLMASIVFRRPQVGVIRLYDILLLFRLLYCRFVKRTLSRFHRDLVETSSRPNDLLAK